jgi:hypothetical protein
MTHLETLPTSLTKDGKLVYRFSNLDGAILIWKRRETRMKERLDSGENIDPLSYKMFVATQWNVLDKIYEMWPECEFGSEGSELLNDRAKRLWELDLEFRKHI